MSVLFFDPDVSVIKAVAFIGVHKKVYLVSPDAGILRCPRSEARNLDRTAKRYLRGFYRAGNALFRLCSGRSLAAASGRIAVYAVKRDSESSEIFPAFLALYRGRA